MKFLFGCLVVAGAFWLGNKYASHEYDKQVSEAKEVGAKYYESAKASACSCP